MTTSDIQTVTGHAPPRLPMSYEEYYAWADEDIQMCIRDSANGTFVDGQRVVAWMPLAKGAVVQIGPYKLVYDCLLYTSRCV